jgi:hypothetical protein
MVMSKMLADVKMGRALDARGAVPDQLTQSRSIARQHDGLTPFRWPVFQIRSSSVFKRHFQIAFEMNKASGRPGQVRHVDFTGAPFRAIRRCIRRNHNEELAKNKSRYRNIK